MDHDELGILHFQYNVSTLQLGLPQVQKKPEEDPLGRNVVLKMKYCKIHPFNLCTDFSLLVQTAICHRSVLLIQAYRPSSKWNELSRVVAEALQRRCYCPFTLEYIADGRLMCSGNDSVVFQGRIISTNSPPNEELLEYLQEWIRSTPTVIIDGVHLQISNCSVHLNELGSTEANCTKPAVESKPAVETGLSAVGMYIIIAVTALLVILIVASTVICSVYCWKKRTITQDERYKCIIVVMQCHSRMLCAHGLSTPLTVTNIITSTSLRNSSVFVLYKMTLH